MSFCSRLVAARKKASLSQKQLAEKIGVTPSRLGNWEQGTRQPDVFMIAALAETLGVTADWLLGTEHIGETKDATLTLSAAALRIAHDYESLDEHGRKVARVVIDEEKERMAAEKAKLVAEEKPRTKIIPLFGASFAAGPGEPDFGNAWDSYEVPHDSPADFAVHITGDSMEPHIKDDSIVLARNVMPKDGEVGAFLVDGDFLCKQYCMDVLGNVYLFSLNRDRADLDVTVWANGDRTLRCFGTILMDKKVPLPIK